ncbi:MAG: heterodisulfide reductase-related iron-sulfur binding cluster [Methanomassiliicoccaceae archaeon]|nr:heterodisulfide reductase-related iron-sulfur binding cluster [Methanomassiliicoccaceae archaeon]
MGKKPLIGKMPRIQKEMLSCLQCGYCIEVCEAHAQTPWESVTPRGKIYYLTQLDKKNPMDKLLNRKVEVSDDFVDAMYKCTGCGSCEVVCHAGIELVTFWEKVRAWLVDIGAGPMPAHKKLVDKIDHVRNPYGESPKTRDAWWPKDVKKEPIPDVIMYAGCTGAYRMQRIPAAGVRVLDRAGVKQNNLGPEEYCCTSPALRTGDKSLTKKSADAVVSKADGMGAKDMVMTCSGCYKTVSTDFGDHYSRAGQNVYHFSQYADKLISERKLALNHPINAKVTYHDPCHLGRHAGVFEEPRNILKKIKGVQLVEMERNRKQSRCCGAGGGYKSAFNDFAVNVAADRIRDAEAVGAEILATSCPFCVLNLSAGAKKLGSKIKVMDISEMLLQVTAPIVEEAAPEAKAEPKAAPEIKAEAVAKPAVKAEAAPEAKAEPKAAPEAKEEAVAKPAVKAEAAPKARAAVVVDEGEKDNDIFGEESEDDSPDLKLRRNLWRNGYRYRRRYGREKITVAFKRAKVGAFVCADTYTRKSDDVLVKKGWTIMRFRNDDVTDAKKETDKVMEAVDRNLELLSKGVIPDGANLTSADVPDAETEENTPEFRLRMALWRTNRYRRNYSKDNIPIAYPRSKVAVFVDDDTERRPIDDKLEGDDWIVLRFKGANIDDGSKEAEKVIAAIEKNNRILGTGDEDVSYITENDPVARLKKAVWNKRLRYRMGYGEENIDLAFVKWKVAVFVDGDGKADGRLIKDGWEVLRFKGTDITDGAKETKLISDALKESDKNLKKKKKKLAKKKE